MKCDDVKFICVIERSRHIFPIMFLIAAIMLRTAFTAILFSFFVVVALKSSHFAKVVIVGAGPTGLASALMFEKHGYEDITIIEKRSRVSFESEKAYLYMVAPNGLQITDYLNFTDKIAEVSVSSFNFRKLKVVEANAEVETKTLPVRTVGKEKFWLPRSSLLDVMLHQVELVNRAASNAGHKPKIQIIFGSQCASIEHSRNGTVLITVHEDEKDKTSDKVLPADILMGADGINSVVRKWLASNGSNAFTRSPSGRTFNMTKYPSDAAGLRYKMLTLKRDFLLPAEGLKNVDVSVPLRLDQKAPASKECAYAIRGTGKTRRSRMSLGLLPVRTELTSRTANIVCLPEHEIWQLRDGPALKAYLQRSFPQLCIDDLVSDEELNRCATSPGGVFPRPQHCDGLYALLYPPSSNNDNGNSTQADGGSATAANTVHKNSTCAVILAGDSAHAFAPDLGQGVNSALEDVFVLHQSLNECHGDLQQALPIYEHKRLPEAIALCKLMVFGYPYQYNQAPRLRKLWLLNFAVRIGLNKILPRVFSPPAFQMIQNYDLTYAEVLRRAHRTTFNLGLSAAALVSATAWLCLQLFRG